MLDLHLPYFAILFIASSIVVHCLGYVVYLRYKETTEEWRGVWRNYVKEHWFYYLTSSAINSFSYVNGTKGLGSDFITKGDDGDSFYHLIGSSVVNIGLILILQAEVCSAFAAFMWALIGIQVTLYALMLCDEGHRTLVRSRGVGVVHGVARVLKIFTELNHYEEQF
jgi:hypothetical protein